MNLNPHKNIEVIKAQSTQGLRSKLQSILTPFGIIEMYHDGENHIAWISPDRKFSDGMRNKMNKADKSKPKAES